MECSSTMQTLWLSSIAILHFGCAVASGIILTVLDQDSCSNRTDLTFTLQSVMVVAWYGFVIAECQAFSFDHKMENERYLGVVCILSIVLSAGFLPWKYSLLITIDQSCFGSYVTREPSAAPYLTAWKVLFQCSGSDEFSGRHQASPQSNRCRA